MIGWILQWGIPFMTSEMMSPVCNITTMDTSHVTTCPTSNSSSTDSKRERFNWFGDHPVLNQIKSWAFEDPLRCQAAFTVYLDLCEAKSWWNVKLYPCHELQMVFMTGKPEKKANPMTVLPICAQEEISVKRMEEFLEHIRPPAVNSEITKEMEETCQEVTEKHDDTITLAVVETDSTIVYYNIGKGLHQPKNLGQIEEDEEEKPKKRQRWKGRKGKSKMTTS
ncbi:tRNA-splicing endonuclease subunit Sen15 [Holothuria leucospilota]|uniref:tRNA-splicing endonuclease subunit Sen15 n=1 Tax=Holothuria leucospilota TaxID=206669 RepID=A0A9Q1C4D9_HOLLE|nr:tRNA-splicing endonuclease subunit Sen15 [Holothuria leucospilota]